MFLESQQVQKTSSMVYSNDNAEITTTLHLQLSFLQTLLHLNEEIGLTTNKNDQTIPEVTEECLEFGRTKPGEFPKKEDNSLDEVCAYGCEGRQT